jgi:uracil-DNA glycosylase
MLPSPDPSLQKRLEKLHARIGACHLCFRKRDNVPVSGRGLARTGGLMLVGQAPGIREPKAQMNFAWTAGKRLFQWLATVGLPEPCLRVNAYITAITKCYPGKSKSGTGDRKPAPWEVENCAPYLDRALGLLKPRVVVPIGSLAVERLLGVKSMSETIGREYRRDLSYGTVYIIPLPHPSGASPWAHLPGNPAKLRRALNKIRYRLRKLGIYGWFQPSFSR